MSQPDVLAAYLCVHVQEEVLVLEDDMEVLRMPTRGVLGSAPEGWGALQLYMLGRIADELYNSPPAAWVPWRPGLFNTGAYLINAAGMRRVSCSQGVDSARAAMPCMLRRGQEYQMLQANGHTHCAAAESAACWDCLDVQHLLLTAGQHGRELALS